MRIKLQLLGLLACLSLTSCTGIIYGVSTGNKSGRGAFYSNVSEPVSVNSNVNTTTKVGKACSTSILGLIAFGDAGVEAAKNKANITKVSTIDVENFSVFVFGQSCTIVKGE